MGGPQDDVALEWGLCVLLASRRHESPIAFVDGAAVRWRQARTVSSRQVAAVTSPRVRFARVSAAAAVGAFAVKEDGLLTAALG